MHISAEHESGVILHCGSCAECHISKVLFSHAGRLITLG